MDDEILGTTESVSTKETDRLDIIDMMCRGLSVFTVNPAYMFSMCSRTMCSNEKFLRGLLGEKRIIMWFTVWLKLVMDYGPQNYVGIMW